MTWPPDRSVCGRGRSGRVVAQPEPRLPGLLCRWVIGEFGVYRKWRACKAISGGFRTGGCGACGHNAPPPHNPLPGRAAVCRSRRSISCCCSHKNRPPGNSAGCRRIPFAGRGASSPSTRQRPRKRRSRSRPGRLPGGAAWFPGSGGTRGVRSGVGGGEAGGSRPERRPMAYRGSERRNSVQALHLGRQGRYATLWRTVATPPPCILPAALGPWPSGAA
jgi:hypothetical protein